MSNKIPLWVERNRCGGTMRKSVNKRERGYTLLEYCAGAAIIAGILWTALSNLGTDLQGLLDAVGTWANSRQDGVVED